MAMKNELDDRAFINELIKVFPNLIEEILDEDNLGLISLQISWLTTYTQQAINKGDVYIAKKSFSFIDKFYDKVSSDVINSIDLSYLIKLEFPNNDLMKSVVPIRLRKVIDDIIDAHKKPMNEKVSKYLESIKHKNS